jgi:hypothetical protein
MATEDERPEFTERQVSLISDSLGNAVDIRRGELLPRILAGLVRTDLREHLRVRHEITPERRKRVERVGQCASPAWTFVYQSDQAGDQLSFLGRRLLRVHASAFFGDCGRELGCGLTLCCRATSLPAAAPVSITISDFAQYPMVATSIAENLLF